MRNPIEQEGTYCLLEVQDVEDDVEDVRAMLVPALRHRIVLSYRAEADGVRDVDILEAVAKRVG